MIKNKIINYTIFAFSFFVWSNLHILHQPDSGQNCIFRGTKSSKVEKKRIFAYICIQKSPISEGAGNSQIRYAIGHMTETAGLGEKGNCVLCGHNGSRNGTFFTNLNQLSAGDKVKITDKRGEVHIYEVADTSVIDPYDNTVKNQSDEEILTLLTCANKGTKRFVCRCIPVKEAGDVDE